MGPEPVTGVIYGPLGWRPGEDTEALVEDDLAASLETEGGVE